MTNRKGMRQTKFATARLGVKKCRLRLRLCQFEMRFLLWFYILAGLLVLYQPYAWAKRHHEYKKRPWLISHDTKVLCDYSKSLLQRLLIAMADYDSKLNFLYECAQMNRIDPRTEKVHIAFGCVQPSDPSSPPNDSPAILNDILYDIKKKSRFLIADITIGDKFCNENQTINVAANTSMLEIYRSYKSGVNVYVSDIVSTSHTEIVSRQERVKVSDEEIEQAEKFADEDFVSLNYYDNNEDDGLRKRSPVGYEPTAMSQEDMELEHRIQKLAAGFFHSQN